MPNVSANSLQQGAVADPPSASGSAPTIRSGRTGGAGCRHIGSSLTSGARRTDAPVVHRRRQDGRRIAWQAGRRNVELGRHWLVPNGDIGISKPGLRLPGDLRHRRSRDRRPRRRTRKSIRAPIPQRRFPDRRLRGVRLSSLLRNLPKTPIDPTLRAAVTLSSDAKQVPLQGRPFLPLSFKATAGHAAATPQPA